MTAKTNQRTTIALAIALLAGTRASTLASASEPQHALHRAVAKNELVAVDNMLGADPTLVNLRYRDGIAPLHLAAAIDSRMMASLLLCHGADPRARTGSGFTALHWAAGRDATNTVAVLLEWGSPLNAATESGITPLHWAARKNATRAISYLLQQGADPEAPDRRGFNALDWAVKDNAREAATLLATQLAERDIALGKIIETPSASTIQPALLQKQDAPTIPPPVMHRAEQPDGVDTSLTLVIPLGRQVDIAFVWIESLGLWMGKYEVTNEQYRRHQPTHSSRFRETFSLNKDRQPVVYASWHQAQAFAQWLNTHFQKALPQNTEFRLPTEAEWMHAARSGDEDRPFPWGASWPPRFGNYSDATARQHLEQWRGIENYDDGHAVACAVELSGANDWGLYGMGGNVWEWCEDWFDAKQTHKVRKGGSWDYDPRHALLIDYRGMDRPDMRSDTVGFRLVVAPKP